MIMRFLKKLMNFLVAFNPMYLILIIKSSIQIETDENLTWNKFSHWFVFSLIILFFVTLIFGLCFVYGPSKKTTKKIELLEVKNLTGNYFLEYFSLFGLLALSFDISNPFQLIVLAVIMLLIAIVYITNNLYYINPLYNLLGYKFMTVKYKCQNGQKIYEANIFTRKSLEKLIGESIDVENSEYDYSRHVIKKKTD